MAEHRRHNDGPLDRSKDARSSCPKFAEIGHPARNSPRAGPISSRIANTIANRHCASGPPTGHGTVYTAGPRAAGTAHREHDDDPRTSIAHRTGIAEPAGSIMPSGPD